VSNGSKARAALEKYFARSFTDLQWEMLAAQGYEQAILTGERTVEAVAAEIQAMMAAVRGDQAGAQPSEPGPLPADPRSWEDMEKWVLARALVSGGSPRVRSVPGAPITGMGTYSSKTPEPPRRRWWLWAALGGLVVAVVVAALLVLLLGGGPTASTTTSPAVTTTAPPVTTTSSATSSSTTSSSTTTSTTGSTTTTEVDLTPTFVADLTGAQAIPAVTTDATGTLTLTVAEDGASVDYVFEVDNLSDLTVARLRVGAAGATGDEILTLYPGPTKAGSFSGVAAEGSFTAAQFLGPLAGKTIADFVALIEAGKVYLNVGTVANRNGELRGQLE
jgi:hypothetical protein